MALRSWHLRSCSGSVPRSFWDNGVIGYIISRTKVEPFIVTLGGMITFQGIALLLCNSREVIMNGELNSLKINLIAGAKDPLSHLNLDRPPYD